MTDYTLEDTIYQTFTTRAFATGAPTTLAGTPVVSAYENDSVTQITAGITLGVDHDTITGLNLLTIVATAANGFEAGKDYNLVITTGTVDSVSVVGEVVGTFSIQRSAAAVDLANGTDGLTALKTAIDDVPTTAEFNARTLAAADYFDPAADTVATVTSVTNQVTANMTAISGDTTAADNLELQYDTTGLTGDTFPARQDQLNSLSSGSAAINTTAESFTATTAGAPTNAYTDTHTLDGVSHIVPPSGGITDVYYTFDVTGDGVPVEASWNGYMQGNGDSYGIYAWNWVGAAWDQIGTRAGSNGTTEVSDAWPLTTAHVGTGADLGKVRVGFQSADGSNVATDRLLLSYTVVQSSLGFVGGAVWMDTVNGETGTGAGVGTISRPVDNIADAKTIAVANNLRIIHSVPASTDTLAAAYDSFEFIGESYTLALGGQSIDGSFFSGAKVSGIGTSSVTAPSFLTCSIGTTTLDPCIFDKCGFETTFALGSAGDYFFVDCFSKVAGSSSPTIDLGALGASNISIRRWSGGLSLTNVAAGDVVSAECVSGGTLTINGTGGTVEVRGMWKQVTDSSGGSVTIVDNAVSLDNINAQCDTALVDYDGPTNTEMAAAFTEIKGATWSASTDTLESIRDRGDAAWITATGFSTIVATDIVSNGAITTLAGAVVNVDLVDTTTTNTDMRGTDGANTVVPATEAQLNARTLLAADYFDPAVDAVANVTLVATTTTNTDMRGTDSAATATALATAQADLDIITGATGVNLLTATQASIDAIETDTGTTLPAQITALNDISAADILTTQLTEAYAADGIAPTLSELMFLVQQTIGDFAISGTTVTVKQIDGSTTAATYTLDDGTSPTSRTRAT